MRLHRGRVVGERGLDVKDRRKVLIFDLHRLGGGAGCEVLALVEVVVVVAVIDRDLAVADVDHAVGHGAHQVLLSLIHI